jgi:tetratricopeptide (TPR) repeat protein
MGQVDMADDYKYDVFISYSHKDEDWVVNTLLPALEDAGLKVCIDFRDFKAGKASIFNMQDSVKESRHVVLNLTRNWLDSEWSLFEALIAATKDPAGLQQKIIPLLSETGIEKDIHDFISMRSWVDFTRKDRERIAWKMLFTALGKTDAPIPGTPTSAKTKIEAPPDWHLAHPYPMPPNFTGRVAERKMLKGWLENDDENRLFILSALGGFGKSALAWYWLTHDVDTKQWSKVVWWSFYEGDASFENFLRETLKYLNVEVPQGQRQQMDALLKVMGAQKILLIMDGFERALRQYANMNAAYQGDEEQEIEDTQRDCVNINAEIFLKNLCILPNIKGKVLMTTRLSPRAVEQRGELLNGCWKEDLQAIQKEDAVAFFKAQGIRGARAEIESACEPYGYHPLSLRILAGLIANDRESPGDIAVAGKLDITNSVIVNKYHVLDVAYRTLSLEQQKLLSSIACFRSSITFDALKSISDREIGTDLRTLERRGLLHWDKTTNKYDLHPIVRRYTYDRLTNSERTSVHKQLINYFDAVPKPQKIEKIEDLAPVIELYHHTVRADEFDLAWNLFYGRIRRPLFYQLGGYQTQIELLRTLFFDGEDKPPRLKDQLDQSHAMSSLGAAYAKNGQPHQSILLALSSIEIDQKIGNKNDFTVTFGNLATQQMVVGALLDAERNLRHSIKLCRSYSYENEDNFPFVFNHEFWGAVGHRETGRVFMYCGKWKDSERELNIAVKMFDKENSPQSLSVTWAENSWRFLLMARAISHSKSKKLKSAIQSATRALDLANESEKIRDSNVVDFLRAHWLLGAAYHAYAILPQRSSAGAQKDLAQAEYHLSEALTRCRAINNVENEADILIGLAWLRYNQKNYEEAKPLAEEALLITERSGYVLQGADVHLFLAELTLTLDPSPEGRGEAREYAEKAKALAYCDGPPYCYKVAYEEAERMLEKLSVG